MSNKLIISFSAVLCFSLVFVVIQYINVASISRDYRAAKDIISSLEDYVCNSFIVGCKEEENEAINRAVPFLTDSSFVVYLPESLCRSCFTTLLFAFQDHSVDYERIIVLCEGNDVEVKAACTARGIGYFPLGDSIDGLFDIIVTRLCYGITPLAIKYNLERDQVFALFLSDDTRFISVLNN